MVELGNYHHQCMHHKTNKLDWAKLIKSSKVQNFHGNTKVCRILIK